MENDMTSIKEKVADLEKGLNSVNTEVAEMKEDIEKKADFEKLQMLESEVEELRNKSRRNNLVFYNVPEKAEGQNCTEFIQNFIVSHIGLEMEQVEIKRAHRTPTHSLNNSMKQPRPIQVAFSRYTDRVKILSSVVASLKDNPIRGNVIGIGPDYAKNTQHRRKALVPYKKHLQKRLRQDRKVFIAYPATLKYLDENGNLKVVSDEDLKKMKGEMANDS